MRTIGSTEWNEVDGLRIVAVFYIHYRQRKDGTVYAQVYKKGNGVVPEDKWSPQMAANIRANVEYYSKKGAK